MVPVGAVMSSLRNMLLDVNVENYILTVGVQYT